MATPKLNPYIILTGAGFTHNFGGYLACKMWEVIFGHPEVQKRHPVKDALLKNTNFESVHHEIMTSGSFDEEDKRSIGRAVIGVNPNSETTS